MEKNMEKNMEKWSGILSKIHAVQVVLQETQESLIKLMVEKEGIPPMAAEQLIETFRKNLKNE